MMWWHSGFLSTSSCHWPTCGSRPSRIVSHPKDKLPWPLPAHPPSGRSLALDRGRILIPAFIWSPPTLAVYDVAHTLLLGGVGGGFPFTEHETRTHFSYFSGTFRDINVRDFFLLASKLNLTMAWVLHKNKNSDRVFWYKLTLPYAKL